MLVLDVGCGDSFPQKVSKIFPDSEAVGLDVESIRGITIRADAENLPFRDKRFDAVLSSHVLEHTLHDFRVMDEFSRVLKSQGRLTLVVPNYNCHRQVILRPVAIFLFPLSKFLAKILRKLGIGGRSGGLGFYKMLYHASSLHHREYRLDEIIHVVLKSNFRILNVELYGVLLPLRRFLPKNIYRSLSRIKAGRYSHSIMIEAEICYA